MSSHPCKLYSYEFSLQNNVWEAVYTYIGICLQKRGLISYAAYGEDRLGYKLHREVNLQW